MGIRSLTRGEAERRVALRGLARTTTSADDLAWLRERTGDDADLRWRALVREAELGGDVASETARLLESDPDPDAWVRALTVRAALPDPAAKAEVWQRLAVDRAVSVGSVAQVAAAFWRPGQDALLAPFTRRYLDSVPRLHEGGMIPAKGFTNHLFPPYAIDSAYIEKARQASGGAEARREGVTPTVSRERTGPGSVAGLQVELEQVESVVVAVGRADDGVHVLLGGVALRPRTAARSRGGGGRRGRRRSRRPPPSGRTRRRAAAPTVWRSPSRRWTAPPPRRPWWRRSRP